MAVERTQGGQRVVVRPTGISRNNAFAGAAAAFDKVSQVGEQLGGMAGDALLRKAETEGAEAGALAGARFDPDGNLLPLQSLPERGTVYGDAYAKAALAAYGSNVVNSARAKASAIQAENPANPTAFEEGYGAWLEETLGAVDPGVRSLIEGDLRSIGTATGSQVFAARAELDRKQQLADIQLNAENYANEVLQLAELGQGATPRAQELIAKQAGLWRTAADAELVTRAEAQEQVQRLSQGIQLQTTMGSVHRALEADDEKGAREILEALRTDTDMPLDPEVRDKVLAVGDRLLDDWWREKEKKRIEAERALAQQRERKYFEFGLKLREAPGSVKPQEIIEAGLTGAQTLSLLGTRDAAVERIIAREQATNAQRLAVGLSEGWVTRNHLDAAKKSGQISGEFYAQATVGLIQEQERQAAAAREAALRSEEGKLSILIAQGAVDQEGLTNSLNAGKISEDFYNRALTAFATEDRAQREKLLAEQQEFSEGMAKYQFIDLERTLPWKPEEVDTVYREAVALGVLTPDEAAGRKEQYLNRWRTVQRDGNLTTALDKIQSGRQLTDNEAEELYLADPASWDALNPENHELIAGRVLAGRAMPSALKRQFQQVFTSARTEDTLSMLALYDRIAADERGRYLFQQAVGTEAASKLDQIAELDRELPQESFGEVLKTALDGFSTRATSANRNLSALGETPQEQQAALTEQARARIVDAIDDNDGLWSAVVGRDPRFATFATELAGQGIDVEELEIPDAMVSQVARTAQRLIERGTYTPDKLDGAIDAAVANAWGTWGAQQDGDGTWRMTQFPITRYAQQSVPTGVPFKPGVKDLKQDLAFKLDSAEVKSLDGKEWNDLDYRFVVDERTLREEDGPRYKVQFQDQFGGWRELPIRYRFNWETSLYNDAWKQAVTAVKDSELLGSLNALTFGIGGRALAPRAAREKLNAIAESYIKQDKAEDFFEGVNNWMTWMGFDAVPPPEAFKDRKFFEPGAPTLGELPGAGSGPPASAAVMGWLDQVFGEVEEETAE